MTKEEIIEMAKQSGAMFDHMTWVERDLLPVFELFAKLVAEKEHEQFFDAAMKSTEKAVDVAMALEREACAKVCEDSVEYAGDELARQIRARGQA